MWSDDQGIAYYRDPTFKEYGHPIYDAFKEYADRGQELAAYIAYKQGYEDKREDYNENDKENDLPAEDDLVFRGFATVNNVAIQNAHLAFKCNSCAQEFPSNNKLFKHLKQNNKCRVQPAEDKMLADKRF